MFAILIIAVARWPTPVRAPLEYGPSCCPFVTKLATPLRVPKVPRGRVARWLSFTFGERGGTVSDVWCEPEGDTRQDGCLAGERGSAAVLSYLPDQVGRPLLGEAGAVRESDVIVVEVDVVLDGATAGDLRGSACGLHDPVADRRNR